MWMFQKVPSEENLLHHIDQFLTAADKHEASNDSTYHCTCSSCFSVSHDMDKKMVSRLPFLKNH